MLTNIIVFLATAYLFAFGPALVLYFLFVSDNPGRIMIAVNIFGDLLKIVAIIILGYALNMKITTTVQDFLNKWK